MKRDRVVQELVIVAVAAVLLGAATVALLPQDQALSARLRAWSFPPLVALLTGVSFFGGAPIEASMVALASLFFAWRRQWPEVWFLLAATATGGLLGGIIRLLVRRDRPISAPAVGLLWPIIGRYSFPSGHALFYTTFFGSMAYLLWARFSGRARWAGIVVCLAMIVLVGPSRIFLGAHWPSDVTAGYLVGMLSVSSIIMLYQWRRGW